MSPQEFYLVWETKRPRQLDEYQGDLSERDLEGLYQMIHEDD